MTAEIREVTRADFPRIVEIINSQMTEPITVEEFARREEARPQGRPYRRVVAQMETGEIVKRWSPGTYRPSGKSFAR